MIGKIISFNGEYYHGTVMEKDNLITKLSINNGEFGAIWFTADEYIAKEFIGYRLDSFTEEESNEMYKVVLLIEVKANKIISLTYEETIKLNKKFKTDGDIREAIPDLKEKGYKGWQVPGSIDRYKYDDDCVFYEELIKVKGISFFIDDEYTDYMNLEKAKIFIENSNKVNY